MRTNMVGYWDHTEQERAALTDEEMTALETLELMEAGIIVPAAPKYEGLESVEMPKKDVWRIYYQDSSHYHIKVHFLTSEGAEQAAEALRGGVLIDSDYQTGVDSIEPAGNIKVGTVKVADSDTVLKLRKILVENKSRKDRNATLKNEYQKAVREQSEALNKMRGDRWEQKEELARCKKISEIWDTYVETCGGNEIIAHRFLLKAYTKEDIEQMNLWLGTKVPTEMVKEAVADEKTTS